MCIVVVYSAADNFFLVNKLKCFQNSGSTNKQTSPNPKQTKIFMNTCQETIYNLIILSIVISASILISAEPGY